MKDISKLIYNGTTIMTQKMNERRERNTNRRNKNIWEIRMQSQIRKWRKELSIVAENGRGSFYGKLNGKKENF